MVLDELNLNIHENEFVTLLEPSGCGKATILRILGGFTNPDKGNVIFDGQDITHMTIAENIAFGLKAKRKSKSYIDDNIRYALKLVNLETYVYLGEEGDSLYNELWKEVKAY